MFTRYAIYFTAQGAFADRGAAWLGWDIAQGRAVEQPRMDGVDLSEATAQPARYGFHGTIKAPFYLAQGCDEQALRVAVKDLFTAVHSASLDGLEIAALGRFLAFVPVGSTAALNELAARVVKGLDPFRAPPTQADLARRRQANLSPGQEANLIAWGYPHVMDSFRFHMTLTARLPRADLPRVKAALETHFGETVPKPMQIDALCLVGERRDGRWQTLLRAPLRDR